jgi:hypothetical protein
MPERLRVSYHCNDLSHDPRHDTMISSILEIGGSDAEATGLKGYNDASGVASFQDGCSRGLNEL